MGPACSQQARAEILKVGWVRCSPCPKETYAQTLTVVVMFAELLWALDQARGLIRLCLQQQPRSVGTIISHHLTHKVNHRRPMAGLNAGCTTEWSGVICQHRFCHPTAANQPLPPGFRTGSFCFPLTKNLVQVGRHL